jgi:NodT family efflux transporter outer membrane factor (OMF) lipoprotein
MHPKPREATRAAALVLPTIVLAVLTAACSVGPDSRRPIAPVATTYKELGDWKVAEPGDDLARGPWWERYGDPELSRLEREVTDANQDLAAAEARFRQASALVSAARADWWPTVTIGVSATRAKRSANLAPSSLAPSAQNAIGRTQNDYAMPIEASWEIDVWGRIRRNVESNEASAQASAADLESVRLSLQATLASDYFQLHALDAQRRLFDETVAAYERSLELTRKRKAYGVASLGDVAQAETQYESARAQAIDVGLARAQLEHAIAVLVGRPAGDFALPPAPLEVTPPAIPIVVPSALLERRPDVASAERSAAAANAQIGVAVAAYYPTVSLGASGGFESTDVSTWLTWPSRMWSIGPSVTETVFDGGKRGALTAQARAAYDERIADYRRTVLAAFQNVEDQLAALRMLEAESERQARAVQAAKDALRITTAQYKAGTVDYLAVVITQAAALANERTEVDVLGRRMVASALLVEALGGGWSTDELPPTSSLAAD